MDLSIVLNVHDEIEYITATMNSIKKSIDFAQAHGLLTEIIVVVDNEQYGVGKKIKQFNFGITTKILFVNNSSLGVSRNDGILASTGRYIILCDADDLISSNYLYEMFLVLEKHQSNGIDVIVCPQYVMTFERSTQITIRFNSELLSSEDFVYTNPYGSRIAFRRQLLTKRMFRDLRKSSGYAFEDWDFNCFLYSIGLKFLVAPNTILFYRNRANSIMNQRDYVRMIPHNELFVPETFAKLSCYDLKRKMMLLTNVNNQYYNKVICENILMLIKEQIPFEPKLKALIFEKMLPITLKFSKYHWGYLLNKMFQLTGQVQYSSVCIVCGDEVQIIEQIRQALRNQPNIGYILIVNYEKQILNPDQLTKLMLENKNIVLLNFHELSSSLSDTTKKSTFLRFMMSISAGKNSKCFVSNRLKVKLSSLDLDKYFTLAENIANFFQKITVNQNITSNSEELHLIHRSRIIPISCMINPGQLKVADDYLRNSLKNYLNYCPILYNLARRVYVSLIRIQCILNKKSTN